MQNSIVWQQQGICSLTPSLLSLLWGPRWWMRSRDKHLFTHLRVQMQPSSGVTAPPVPAIYSGSHKWQMPMCSSPWDARCVKNLVLAQTLHGQCHGQIQLLPPCGWGEHKPGWFTQCDWPPRNTLALLHQIVLHTPFLSPMKHLVLIFNCSVYSGSALTLWKSPEEISLICTFLELTPTVYNSTSILGPRNEHFFSSTIGVSDADTLRKKVVPIRPHFLISNLSQISQVCFFTISVSISVGDLAEWFSNFSLYYNHQGSL